MKRSPATNPVVERLADLCEPTRLRLIRVLEAEELTVGELARVLQLPQSTVSRHLRVLADGGWLRRRTLASATGYRLVLDDLEPGARGLWLSVREQLGEGGEFAEDARRVRAVLSERPVDSRSFFDRVAGEWAAVRRELFGRGFTAPALLSLIPPAWEVADVGCGTGEATEWLAPRVARVVAVDRSPEMLASARERLGALPGVEFVQGEAEALPLADASVDAVVLSLVLHHLEHPEGALREAARVLRTDRGGGVALVLDMAAHERREYRERMGHVHLGFAPEAIAALFADTGFQSPSVVALPTDPDGSGPGLFAASGRLRR